MSHSVGSSAREVWLNAAKLKASIVMAFRHEVRAVVLEEESR
jgi:hypothetical protein